MELKKQVAVRFTETQYAELERLSREAGISTLGTFLRSVVMRALDLPWNGSITTVTASNLPSDSTPTP